MTVVFFLSRTRMPNSGFLDWYTGKNVEFNKDQLPTYARLVVGTIILSILVGYVVTPENTSAVMWFTGLNAGIMAVGGVNLVLYRSRKNDKK